MKNKTYRVALLAAAAAAMPWLASCDDVHETYVLEEAVAVAAPQVSVANGDVLAVTTGEITLTYSVPVALNSGASITLNDAALEAALDESRTVVTLPVALSYGETYTLTVPERAVAGLNTRSFAPAVTVTFTAEPRPALVTNYDANLINSSATAEAKAVYRFLLEQNGKKVLSGASAGDGNNNNFADWVASHATQYPALACYDFLHHKRSGENWIDYTDISAAVSQWQNNGLVNYMWHWTCPPTKRPITTRTGTTTHSIAKIQTSTSITPSPTVHGRTR
ncbi:MAG: glycoside hydrolase family 26 protein [Muribaculaceae bacterium]|nr:glycoside hydrolase family 26 protein [Muribaculaceae bacterium]